MNDRRLIQCGESRISSPLARSTQNERDFKGDAGARMFPMFVSRSARFALGLQRVGVILAALNASSNGPLKSSNAAVLSATVFNCFTLTGTI